MARSIPSAAPSSIGLSSTPNDCATADPRRDLLQQFQPLAAQAVFELHESGRVATRLCQTFDIAVADRIDALCEYDWHGPCRLQQCRRGPADPGEDSLRIERDQLGRISRQVREGADAPAIIDPQVASDRPARFRKPLQERQQARLRFRIVRTAVHEHADAPHPLGLLRARRERPRSRRAAE